MENQSEIRWPAARERMRLYIHAVLWQDLDVEELHTSQSTDYILDRIVKPEFDALAVGAACVGWSLWRQDDNGNRFEVARDLAAGEVARQFAAFEAAAHKQTYWAAPTKNERE